MIEVHLREALRRRVGLRINELQFIAVRELQSRVGLWTHANPVNTGWRLKRSVAFDAHVKSGGVQRSDQRRVQLQQRLTASAHHIRLCVLGRWPFLRYGASQG